jgi:hypothetical protein
VRVPLATIAVVGATVAVALVVENLALVAGVDDPAVRGGDDRTGRVRRERLIAGDRASNLEFFTHRLGTSFSGLRQTYLRR